VLLLAGTAAALFACAEVMNVLEQGTDENSVEGKLIRGANRLRKSFQELDPSEEHYIGRAVAAQVLADPKYPLSQDEAMVRYVNLVGNGIVMSAEEVRHTFNGYQFAVLDTAEVNAFACPGGLILVTRGMVTKARNEDELAAVLAHEVAHVSHRHGLAAIQSSNLAAAFKYLGSAGAQVALEDQEVKELAGVFDSTIGDIVGVFEKGYSRDAEREADRSGARFLAAAGYDAGALEAVLARMVQESGGGGVFATHPGGAERVRDAHPVEASHEAPADVALRAARFAAHVKSP
jgi:predicted Zn-dependent protease